ncbi:MAG: glutamate--tRNA ligase [Gammaproteobacteria bacterium]
MHLGNARTALFSWLLARKLGGRFLLRIEDTDRERHNDAAEGILLDDLHWLGLSWDEGPQHMGNHSADPGAGPYRQSERTHIYEQMYAQLADAGLTYPCFCSPETLAVQRKTQLAAGKPPRYAGTCARLTEAQQQEKRAKGMTPTMRFRVPAAQTVSFTDLVHGAQKFNTDDIGDFIIRRADGSSSFFFCNAVDDALMNITHVIRGDDHLTNTPRQLLLLKALNLPAPEYGHVSLILGGDGAPLSKRHGSASVEDLRERGLLPGAVVNLLARLGHYYAATHYMSLSELARDFDLARLGTAPSHFDEQQLTHWQREAVAHADDAVLAEWLSSIFPANVSAAERANFAHAVRGNVLSPDDARAWFQIVNADKVTPGDEAKAILATTDKSYFAAAVTAAAESGADFNAFINRLKALTPEKGKALFQPLRAALTGRLDGPELASLFGLLGADRIRRRLEEFAL